MLVPALSHCPFPKHYPPEVCVRVNLINFGITFSGLEDQLLGWVVIEERPDMEEKKAALTVANARNMDELAKIEDTILYMLANSTGNILDDVVLIDTLAQSKVTSSEINAKVAESARVEQEIDVSRELYRPAAYASAVLYFVVASLAEVDAMYQYSLDWYTDLFVRGIRQAPKPEDSADLPKRLELIDDFFTYYLYCNVCRLLFEKDKLLFSFLMTVKILQSKKVDDGPPLVDPDEWRFLYSGKGAAGGAKLENPAPDWIDARMWDEMLGLGSLPQFAGFVEDLVGKDLKAWRAIYDSLEPHSAEFPGRWKDLGPFHRIMVLRCVRADKVPDAVTTYVIDKLGQRFVEPPPFHLPSCYEDATCCTPLVFILTKGSDPGKAFFNFAKDRKMDKKVASLSLGQGQEVKAEKMIEEGIERGTWV